MKEIRINVYGDCTSEAPTKTYTVRRLLFKTAKELGALQADAHAARDDEQMDYAKKMLKCIVPDFEDEDFDGIDPVELGAIFRELGAEIGAVMKNAEKN